jgi:hypothetical protein
VRNPFRIDACLADDGTDYEILHYYTAGIGNSAGFWMTI